VPEHEINTCHELISMICSLLFFIECICRLV